jgi:hypothetical protein
MVLLKAMVLILDVGVSKVARRSSSRWDILTTDMLVWRAVSAG